MSAVPFLARVAVLFAALAVAGCRASSSDESDGGGGEVDAGDPATDAGPDAAPGVGCTPLEPRTVDPELFIGPDGIEARFLALIDGAQQELWLSMYLFTVDSLATALVDAHQRGVDVRVILDPDHEGNPDVRDQLDAAGVPVRDAAASFAFYHIKAMVIDGATAVLGSTNFAYGALNDERNYDVIDRDPDDVADLRAIIDSDWQAVGFPDLSCTRLLVSPVNARSRMLAHINGADDTLDLEAMYIADSSVRTAIIAAHARGVAVRILFADPDDMPENADTAALFADAGISVRALAVPFVHAKLVIADGVAWIGSQNFSNGSLTQNREVGILVHEAAPAAAVQAQYDEDWAAGFAL